jgi:hypothetical protein
MPNKCHDCGKPTTGKSRCDECAHRRKIAYRKRRAAIAVARRPPPPELPPGMSSWCKRCDQPIAEKKLCPACKVIKYKDKCRSCGKPISGYGTCERCKTRHRMLAKLRREEGHTKEKCPYCGRRAHPYKTCASGEWHRRQMERRVREVMGDGK